MSLPDPYCERRCASPPSGGEGGAMARVEFWQTIGDSLAGKAKFRLILQPAMAILLGFRLGIADAKDGRMPFIRRLATSSGERWKVFKHSFREALLPLALALIVDAIVQYLLLHSIRPVAALVVGLLLVWLPFVVLR